MTHRNMCIRCEEFAIDAVSHEKLLPNHYELRTIPKNGISQFKINFIYNDYMQNEKKWNYKYIEIFIFTSLFGR